MMKFLSIIIISIIFTQASCKKPNIENLPPETQEGLYTFGCKVDGKIYTSDGKGGGVLSNEHVFYHLYPADSSLSIFAGSTDNQKNKFDIFFTIKYDGNIGVYMMKTYPYEGIFNDNSNGTIPGASNTFTTSENYQGKINIKYFNGRIEPFYGGNILSGTFEMDAVNEEGKVIHITEGRFDIGP